MSVTRYIKWKWIIYKQLYKRALINDISKKLNTMEGNKSEAYKELSAEIAEVVITSKKK